MGMKIKDVKWQPMGPVPPGGYDLGFIGYRYYVHCDIHGRLEFDPLDEFYVNDIGTLIYCPKCNDEKEEEVYVFWRNSLCGVSFCWGLY